MSQKLKTGHQETIKQGKKTKCKTKKKQKPQQSKTKQKRNLAAN